MDPKSPKANKKKSKKDDISDSDDSEYIPSEQTDDECDSELETDAYSSKAYQKFLFKIFPSKYLSRRIDDDTDEEDSDDDDEECCDCDDDEEECCDCDESDCEECEENAMNDFKKSFKDINIVFTINSYDEEEEVDTDEEINTDDETEEETLEEKVSQEEKVEEEDDDEPPIVVVSDDKPCKKKNKKKFKSETEGKNIIPFANKNTIINKLKKKRMKLRSDTKKEKLESIVKHYEIKDS